MILCTLSGRVVVVSSSVKYPLVPFTGTSSLLGFPATSQALSKADSVAAAGDSSSTAIGVPFVRASAAAEVLLRFNAGAMVL